MRRMILGLMALALAASPAAAQNALVNYGDGSGGKVLVKPATPLPTYRAAAPTAWRYAAAASGISNTTTAVTVKTAAGAGVRNYIDSMQCSSTALGAATEFAIRDGAAGTVLFRINLTTAGLPAGQSYRFEPPLRGTANTLLEIVTLTATTTGALYCNLQGQTAP